MAAKLNPTNPPSAAKPAAPSPRSPQPAPTAAPAYAVLLWAERAMAALLIATAVVLSIRVWLSSGGLWRDEVNSVNLVSWPLADIWGNLQYDSFPMLWFLVLKAWIAVFGGSDFAIRGLGLATSLGVIAAVWWTGRAIGARAPLISLSLFGLMPALVVYGGSIRAFGMGVALIVLTLGAMWKMAEKPTPWRFAAACLAAILSVQCLYHNCVLLLGIGVGAAAACAVGRRWIAAILPLAIGAVAAITMLPYRQTITQIGTWNIIIKQQVDYSLLLTKFASTLDPSGTIMFWVWLGLTIVSLVFCVRSLLSRSDVAALPSKQTAPSAGKAIWARIVRGAASVAAGVRSFLSRRKLVYLPARATAVFVLVAITFVPTAYLAFLKGLSYPTQVWYYLPVAAVLALVLEAGLSAFFNAFVWTGALRIVAALAIAVPLTSWAWGMGGARQTNIDLVSAKLETLADKDDYIVLNPFFLGVTFSRYYHGTTPWATLPDIAEHRIHRYDLFMQKMTEPQPVLPVLVKIQQTLLSGHHVWLVLWGDFQSLPPGQRPVVLPPAPNSRYGWSEGYYQASWTQQLAAAIQPASSWHVTPVPCDRPVGPFEGAAVLDFSGWRL